MQRSQRPAPTLHTGAPVEQSLLVVQAGPQRPSWLQTGAEAGHWLSELQAPQAPVPRLQMGVVPPQSATAVHPRQWPLEVSQTGAEAGHCALEAQAAVHCPLGWQTGVPKGH